ncbi:glycosyltransferase family 4 protein [Ideonella sp. DXS29W]|uniref:Glycosyltransferase family 4 protein n=1 Tax=Ideonella lacteola TaxID=2984193 RepID=A0ABU9BPH2_9BURK
MQSTAGAPTVPWSDVIRRLLAEADGLQAACEYALACGQPLLATAIAGRLLERRMERGWLAAACRVAYEAADLSLASAWAGKLAAITPPSDADRALMAAIAGRIELLARLDRPGPARPGWTQEPRRVLAMLAFSMPFTSNGYATRSNGLLSAVRAAGWDVQPFTRPGYPADADRQWAGIELPVFHDVGVLRYRSLPQPSRRELGLIPYLQAAADQIGRTISELRPGLVHAASNYTTALPACVAAREQGLPFVYEVRGFWDVTRASSDPKFARSTEYRYLQLFERALLQKADSVITLTEAMKDELVRRGAPADRIVVAPNAVDVDRLVPVPRDMGLANQLGLPEGMPVIGYVGSFVDYEGLDDLVEACAILHHAGRRFRLLMVGDGLAWPDILRRITEVGLHGCSILPGRVPHDYVPAYYSLMDLCPFPRKPWPVCELVSPLKPFEAMAMGKAVLVSSVAALAGSVIEEVNGRVFDKGDPSALAKVLARGLDDLQAARELGLRARQWVTAERTWHTSARAVERAYALAVVHRGAAG